MISLMMEVGDIRTVEGIVVQAYKSLYCKDCPLLHSSKCFMNCDSYNVAWKKIGDAPQETEEE